MEKTRLEILRETVATDPDNTFGHYGLAMELQNTGQLAEAMQHFGFLLTQHPEYSAAYFQASMLLVKMGRSKEAQKVLESGIEVTGRQGKTHAQSELQQALSDLASE